MKKSLLLYSLLLLTFAADAQCIASFTAAQAPLNNNLLRVVFANSSSFGTVAAGQVTQSFFNFGDGTYSTTMNPIHIYASPGSYTIGLRIYKKDTVTLSVVCTDTISQTITVSYPACGTTMSITGSTYSATRTFTAATPAGTTGMTYSWNFGDGNTGTGSPAIHTYSSTGTYSVTLVATHASGPSCSYTNIDNTVVNYLSYCSYLHSTLPFGAYFIGNTVTIAGIIHYTGLITTITYNYGDGSGNTGSASHIYATPGTFSIKKIVQWSDSATSTPLCLDSIVQNATVPSVIRGDIYFDSMAFTGTRVFKVYMIQFNAITNILSALDSTTVNAVHRPGSYIFQNVPAGNYLIKAADTSVTTGITGLVPTYHDSSLYWSTAQTVAHPGLGNSIANIWMRTGTTTGGPGFVGGNVSLGANKGSSDGVAGANILLRDAANSAIACAKTNSAGDFSFSNIPAGNYSVYPEVMNFATTPANISITTGVSSIDGVNFNKDDAKMNIMPQMLGTILVNKTGDPVSLSPNPASQSVRLSWIKADTRGANVLIRDVTGRIVMQVPVQNHSASGAQLLDISTLRSGIYFVQCTEGLAATPIKLVVQ